MTHPRSNARIYWNVCTLFSFVIASVAFLIIFIHRASDPGFIFPGGAVLVPPDGSSRSVRGQDKTQMRAIDRFPNGIQLILDPSLFVSQRTDDALVVTPLNTPGGPNGLLLLDSAGMVPLANLPVTNNGSMLGTAPVLLSAPSPSFPQGQVLVFDPTQFNVTNSSTIYVSRPNVYADAATVIFPVSLLINSKGDILGAVAGIPPGDPNGPALLGPTGELDPSQLPAALANLIGAPLLYAAPYGPSPNASVLTVDANYFTFADYKIAPISRGAAGLFQSADIYVNDAGYIVNATSGAILNAPFLLTTSFPGLAQASIFTAIAGQTTFNGSAVGLATTGVVVGTYTCPSSLVIDFFGRITAATNGSCAINANSVFFNGIALSTYLNSSFLTVGPSSLPNGAVLSGTTNEITVSGPVISLSPFGTDGTYYPASITVVKGRILSAVNGSAPITQTTVNDISGNATIVAGSNIAVSTSVAGKIVTVATVASPTFTSETLTATSNQLTVNSAVINVATPTGTPTYTVPNLGTSSFMMTAGGQTIVNSNTMLSALIIQNGAGINMFSSGNVFSTSLRQSTVLAQNTVFNLPATNGVANNILLTNGLGDTFWGTLINAGLSKYAATTNTISSNPGAAVWVSVLPFSGVGQRSYTAAQLTIGSIFEFSARGSVSSVNTAALAVRLMFNSTVMTTATLPTGTTFANSGLSIQGECVIKAAGSASCGVTLSASTASTTITINSNNVILANYGAGVPITPDIQFQFSNANAANAVTTTIARIKLLIA